MPDLQQEVVSGLKNRRVAEWDAIAKSAKVSASMLAQLARGHYKSSPTYRNLTRIAEALKKFPRAA